MDVVAGNSNNNNASSKTEKLKENGQSVQVINFACFSFGQDLKFYEAFKSEPDETAGRLFVSYWTGYQRRRFRKGKSRK